MREAKASTKHTIVREAKASTKHTIVFEDEVWDKLCRISDESGVGKSVIINDLIRSIESCSASTKFKFHSENDSSES